MPSRPRKAAIDRRARVALGVLRAGLRRGPGGLSRGIGPAAVDRRPRVRPQARRPPGEGRRRSKTAPRRDARQLARRHRLPSRRPAPADDRRRPRRRRVQLRPGRHGAAGRPSRPEADARRGRPARVGRRRVLAAVLVRRRLPARLPRRPQPRRPRLARRADAGRLSPQGPEALRGVAPRAARPDFRQPGGDPEPARAVVGPEVRPRTPAPEPRRRRLVVAPRGRLGGRPRPARRPLPGRLRPPPGEFRDPPDPRPRPPRRPRPLPGRGHPRGRGRPPRGRRLPRPLPARGPPPGGRLPRPARRRGPRDRRPPLGRRLRLRRRPPPPPRRRLGLHREARPGRVVSPAPRRVAARSWLAPAPRPSSAERAGRACSGRRPNPNSRPWRTKPTVREPNTSVGFVRRIGHPPELGSFGAAAHFGLRDDPRRVRHADHLPTEALDQRRSAWRTLRRSPAPPTCQKATRYHRVRSRPRSPNPAPIARPRLSTWSIRDRVRASEGREPGATVGPRRIDSARTESRP